ncbi:MAG TPA: hypothetical protein VM243_01885 [Phycisphaerae bacterium]|nr:hypothetical protein [Phycisphaerae bacterium]
MDRPGIRGRWVAVTGSAGCLALASAAVLLACGQEVRASFRLADRSLVATWSAAPAGPAQIAGVPASTLPPPFTGAVVLHGNRSVATTAVLVEHARRVNLSRLGGLYGP